ncbi:MAG: PTS sugar transporter subunit IIA [Acidobacteriota bacterium]|jgi:PTS system mannose-specific IIA component|nr:PTS sugar transporter subunit IIA [Acidobacteriota bacterium]
MEKIGGVIVTHGQLANEFLKAAEHVVGDLDHIASVSIGWNDDVEQSQKEIKTAIEKVSNKKGVLLLTDMFGGTPTNISAMFIKKNEVEVITGVNLPMVIKIASQNNDLTLSELAEAVEAQGKQSIYRAEELLTPQKLKKDG